MEYANQKNKSKMEYIQNEQEAMAVLNALEILETKVLESPEFKLLYGKTQMFYDDHGRSRGGHSYNIGETAGSMAGKLFEKIYGSREDENPKLFEINQKIQEITGRIMGYSHDLGHTPLGHDGESVLDKKLGDLTSKDPALRDEVEAQRRKDFAGVKITVPDEETKELHEYDYEEYQAMQREQKAAKKSAERGEEISPQIGYEHNEYSAQIFARLMKEAKETAEKNPNLSPEIVSALKELDEIKFMTAILAHSRSRFPGIPEDYLAQAVRQADKVEYMNYDFEEYQTMGFFPMEENEENINQHESFMALVKERAEAEEIDLTEMYEYMKLSGYDRRMNLEDEMVKEAVEGLDGHAPKGRIDDNMAAMKKAKICAKFKDDALFYLAEDGKRGLITGNNVERQEVILDRLLQFYVDHPDRVPNTPVQTSITKLNRFEHGDLIQNGEEVTSFNPENIVRNNNYERLKTYLSTLTNEQVEKQYQQLVQERIREGKGHGIEPVTQENINKKLKETRELATLEDKKTEEAKETGKKHKRKIPYSLSHSKIVKQYMPNEMIARAEENRKKHAAEIAQDQMLYDQMIEADRARVETQRKSPTEERVQENNLTMREAVSNSLEAGVTTEDIDRADQAVTREKQNTQIKTTEEDRTDD